MKQYALLLGMLMLITGICKGQSLKKIETDKTDIHSGHYLVVEPENPDSIKGVLFLLAGFGQIPENTPPETGLHNVAFANNLLTVFYAAGNKLYADSVTRVKISTVVKDVLKRYKVNKNAFVFGGFSAGGMIAMRYVELCLQYPGIYPVNPAGIFTVDSPIDIFTIYEHLEESAANRYSEPAVEEAERAIRFIKEDHGIPREHIPLYSELTAFSMNKEYGQNELFLRNTAVRTYHDVDIAWRINNRNQTVHNSNYEVTAELINRLVLLGNKRAEFMQTFKTGYRANGERHPHSWSIVNEVDCIQWVNKLIREADNG